LLEIGTRVKLNKFNGTIDTPKDCDKSENYWSLIGESGIVIQPKNSCSRVLIQFENIEKLKNLHCHNEVESSLWILESDVELYQEHNKY